MIHQKYNKRFLLLLVLLAAVTFANAQIKVEASEKVELMAILSRTAGFREYCMDMGGQYTKDTEAWFAPYKQHPAVVFMKDLRSKYNLGYDAMMTMAINLETDGKKITMTREKQNLGNRWQNIEIDTFLVHLNQFYADTRFHDFYTRHQSFYESVLRVYVQNVMQHFHQDWFPRFYGTEPTERFHVVIGFTNGGGNYGPSRQLPGHPKEVFAICGYSIDEKTGKAFENGQDYATTLIHEFNHSFVNSLYDTHANLLEPVGKKLFRMSYRGMAQQAYKNVPTVINESIVRAAVIIYMQDNGFTAEQIKAEMDEQIGRSFLWMPELVGSLCDYSKHRKRYKTLSDYCPEIAKCLDKYVKKEEKRQARELNKLKHIPEIRLIRTMYKDVLG